MDIIVLGSGSAKPIPRGDRCKQCLSKDPRDRRFPSALLVKMLFGERSVSHKSGSQAPQERSILPEGSRSDRGHIFLRHTSELLIDCPPMIDQLIKPFSEISKISCVITTHNHDDAAGGIKFFPKKIINYPLSIINSFSVPHGRATAKGFLINNLFVYCSDYSDIKPALPYLKKSKIAFLDGSGWDRVFPSHQPMKEVIPIVKKLKNLKSIYFTHNGHTHIPHAKLEQMVQSLSDRRFKLAYHGMRVEI